MLVLTRRIGEELVIDGNIIVKVLAVNGRTIRLGVTAPPEVAVLRQEICQQHALVGQLDEPSWSRHELLLCAD